MSSQIFHTFGKKRFIAFLVAEIIGIVLIGINFIPGNNRISLVFLVGGILLMGVGFQTLWKSFKTPHCSKCKEELNEKKVSFLRENEEKLITAIRESNATLLPSLELTRNDAKKRCELILEYCPKCLEIGLANITTIDEGKKTKILENQLLQGEFVKALEKAMID